MADEVYVRALDLPLQYLDAHEIATEPILASVGLTLKNLTNKSDTIDWSTFVTLLRRVATAIGGAEHLPDVGRFILSSRLRWVMMALTGPFLRQEAMYHWVSRSGHKLMFRTSTSTCRETAAGIELTITLPESLELSEEFTLINKGLFEAYPGMLGYPPASVNVRQDGRTTTYQIVLSPNQRFIDRLRAFWRRFQLRRGAAQELEKSLAALNEEHRQLLASHTVVEKQARLLGTIEAITRSMLQGTDAAQIASAVVEALVADVGFASAAYYSAIPERTAIELAASKFHGPSLTEAELAAPDATAILARLAEDEPTIRVEPLAGDGRLLALVVARPREDGTTDRALFDALLPHLTIAAKHGFAYNNLTLANQNLEEKVRQRTGELWQANQDLLASHQKLEHAMAARDRMMHNLNHEFRTPLTLLLLPLERLRDKPQFVSWREQFDSMILNARKLLRLVDDLLELAASHEGRLRFKLERVDVSRVTRETLAAYRPGAEQLGLALGLTGDEQAIVLGAPSAIARVLDNLLSNALKYTPRGGRVDVEIRALADTVKVLVRDTGIGIPEADQRRIFERFEKSGAPVAPGASSSGLGLALVRELCAWHGGAVAVASRPNEGSTFEITLPCTPSPEVLARQDRREAGAPGAERRRRDDLALELGAPRGAAAVLLAPPAAHAPPPPPAAPVAGAPTLLVVEDHPDLRAHLVEILAPHFHVLAAENGRAAWELLQTQSVDLILSDLVMPDMDGLALCQRVKDRPSAGFLPFLLVTALHDNAALVRALDQGVDDFIVKPFNEPELLARVRAQLRIRDLARSLAESSRAATTATLLSAMAHELRNPVNVLVNGVAPLRDALAAMPALADPDTLQLVDAIAEASRRVADLSEELLALRAPPQETGERVQMATVIEQSLALLRPKLTGVTVRTEMASEGEVVGSVRRLSQVVANLLENALQAVGGPGRGQIGIAARDGPDSVEVEVWDDGPGVAPEQRDRIFEPFYTTHAAGAGHGLGLAISRQIAERYGGKLDLAPGEHGARFRLTLPRAAP